MSQCGVCDIHNEIYLLRRATIDDASECALIIDNWIKLLDQIKAGHKYLNCGAMKLIIQHVSFIEDKDLSSKIE